MRHLYVAVFGALLAQSCFPQLALTGHWVAEQAGSDGEKRQRVLFTLRLNKCTGDCSRNQEKGCQLESAILFLELVQQDQSGVISRTSITAFCAMLCSVPAAAAPPMATRKAFDRYAAAVEDRIRSDSSTANFLRVLPDESKRARARRGEVLVESAQGLGVRPDVAIPNGQVQHWVGAAFLQDATMEGVLPRLRNYNNRSRYMMPEIVESRLKDRQGDVFQVYLRLVEKAILSGVFDLDLRVVYRTGEHGRLAIESRSMSVVAVSDASAPVGSAGKDQGLLWALNHYWRILPMDGGLYVECEALVLSRPTPLMLGWIAHPIIARAARESLIRTVHATIRIMNSPDAAN